MTNPLIDMDWPRDYEAIQDYYGDVMYPEEETE